MINNDKCTHIFDALINGRVINAHVIGQDETKRTNPLFAEIMMNQEGYKEHFARCGKTLDIKSDFVILREPSAIKTDITIKVSVLLLLMGKYLNVKGWSVDKVMEVEWGLSDDDIKEMSVIQDGIASELLKKADIKGDLLNAFQKILVDRGIMIKKPISKKYVLGDAGNAFFNEIFENFKDTANV